MNPASPTSRLGHLPVKWLLDYLHSRGLSLQHLCDQLEVDEHTIISKSGFVETTLYFRILNVGARELSNSLIGADIALNLDSKSFGLMGYLFQHAPTLRTSFDFIQRYYKLFSWDAEWETIRLQNKTRCIYKTVSNPNVDTREDIDLAIASVIRSCKEIGGADWHPIGCGLSYSQPKNTDGHKVYFGPNVVFDQAENFIEIEDQHMDCTRGNADSVLLGILLQQADQLIEKLESDESIIQRVRLLIVMSFGARSITTEEVAIQLNMSVRKLHRQLEKQKTSFRKIREEAILSTAKEKLRTSDLNVTLISQSLGYTEASSFNRSFKKMTGLTPIQYRKQYSGSA